MPSTRSLRTVLLTAPPNLQGIGWMVLSGLFFVLVTGAVRHLAGDMNPMQAAFLRYFIGLLLVLPLILRARPVRLAPPRLGYHALRGLLHGIGVLLWFFAMSRIPIAQVTALGFTAPVFATILAALLLGETLRLRRLTAVLVGLAGAIIILRPGVDAIDIGAIAMLGTAPLFAISIIMAKKLTETESNPTIVGYLSVFVTLTLLPPALLVWRTPTLVEIGWLTFTAVAATLGHFAMTQAFRRTEITVTQPFSFLQLVWATLLGLYVFGEQPDIWTWIGGGVIVASATYIAHRETMARRRSRAPVSPPTPPNNP